MRRAHVRHRVIGDQQPDAGEPAMPATQTIRMPAMKNSALHTSAISIVWPKSGCTHQQRDHRQQQHE